jgi:cyclin A
MTEPMDCQENISAGPMPAIKPALTAKQNRPVLGLINQNINRSNNSTQPLKPPRIALSQVPKVNVFQDNNERRPSVGSDCSSVGKGESFMVRDSPMIPESISSIDSSPRTSRRLAVVPNLDTDLSDPFYVPEYASDIDQHLRESEQRTRPKPHYMRKQNDLTSQMRTILIDWLVEVTIEYKMNDETLYLAVNYIDRFLSQMAVLRGKLQLVGTAAMLIASKFEEIYAPEVNEFVFITDDTYTRQQVLRMEHLMIKVLNFDICAVTPLQFLHRFLKAVNADSQTDAMARFLCDLTLLEYNLVKYAPSLIATAAVVQAVFIITGNGWNDSIEHYSAYSWSQVLPVISEIQVLHQISLTSSHQTVLEKFKAVSGIPPRSGTPPNIATGDSLNMTDCSV